MGILYYWLRRGDLMGSAHHSLREHPIMFASSCPLVVPKIVGRSCSSLTILTTTPTNAPYLVHRTRSRVLPREPVGQETKYFPNRKETEHQVVFCFLLVAERGFEPPDLRVMSPTSYLAALLRDIYLCLSRVLMHYITIIICCQDLFIHILNFYFSYLKIP